MAKAEKKNPLIEYAAKNKPHGGTGCSICVIPERETIDEARRNSPSYGNQRALVGGGAVRNWLIAECGYTEKTAPSAKAIQSHFTSGHHKVET